MENHEDRTRVAATGNERPSHHRAVGGVGAGSPPLRSPPPLLGQTLRKGQLSPNRQWLVETMQNIGFGEITFTVNEGGDPVRDPPPRIRRQRRLTGANHRRPECTLRDFILKGRLLKLFRELRDTPAGTVVIIRVQEGLPYTVMLEEPDRP